MSFEDCSKADWIVQVVGYAVEEGFGGCGADVFEAYYFLHDLFLLCAEIVEELDSIVGLLFPGSLYFFEKECNEDDAGEIVVFVGVFGSGVEIERDDSVEFLAEEL